MPFETMGQRRLSTSSCFLEETSFPSEKKFGFWKPKGTHYCQVGLSKNSVLVHKSADAVASCIQQVELLGSTEEIDSKIIGNLLPDEDDLFSGVINELDHIADANRGNDAEDVDLFSSVGGMELEVDNGSCAVQKNSKSGGGILSCWSSSDGFYASKDSLGQHPSRTLSVRNINCNVEDFELRALFEKYGDVQTLCTACKHRGIALISYFDIRAARNAMRNLNNKMLGHWRLDIHYSIPKDNPSWKDFNHGTIFVFNINSSIATDALHQIFGVYGEIKEIREALCKCHHKFIEFYDVRAAEAACQALDKCNIAGKQIKLELNCPEDARHCSNKCSELEQDESGQSRSSNDLSLSETMSTFPLGDTTVSCFSNGSVQRLQSASALSEKALSHGSCVLDTFRYPPRMASASDQFGPHKPSQSLGQVEFGNKCFESCHPYSFLDCQNISNPCESPNTVANMVGRIGARLLDKKIGGHTSTRSLNWQPMELEEWVAGPFSNATHPVNGHHWSNSTLCHHHPSSPMVWPDFPLFSNGVNAPCSKQLLGPFGTSPDVLNTVSPPRHLHVGSAPCIRPPFWNTQHSYTRESPEDLAVCLDSLRSEDFAGSFPLQLLGRPSHIFSNTLRNCMEKSSNDALHSPHQMSHISCGRTMVSSFPTTLASPSNCGRTFSHRRNQHSANQQTDKKQFELDIHRILRGEDSRTTLMIKNIPNKYTSKMLLATIDEHCRGSYDFIYLPIDFKNKCNVGYAFINLIDHLQIIPFHKAFSGKKWEKFNSEKVTALAYARIQGKAALIAHFQNSSLMNEDKRCRPILFSTGGPNAGQQEPFPIPTNIRSKASKAQNDFNENRQQGSLSTSVNGENSPNSLNSCGSSADSD
ncbi:protein MEI2-like 4 isoform X2 [Diospyros lotus]|uniref:protein MEI2-like 4 isoform X2 n=1 Tax=Diospyros lotus TaxID=55363 RepID=UPI0022523951|nr:protein MEI2-like 4 isoform X2 [Diospyros lotus]